MGRVILLLSGMLLLSPAFAGYDMYDKNGDYDVSGGGDRSLTFKEALERADNIFLAQTERVEVITPERPNGFDRRALVRVLDVFKGKKQKETFIYYKSKVGHEGHTPGAVLSNEKYAVYFVKDNRFDYSTATYKTGSFDLSYYPDKMKYAPMDDYCQLEALKAYKKKRPLEEVLRTAQKCKRDDK